MNIKMMISRETDLKENQVAEVLGLLDQGSTVPLIARYRKERTGSQGGLWSPIKGQVKRKNTSP